MTTRRPFLLVATAAMVLVAVVAFGAGTVLAQDPHPAAVAGTAVAPGVAPTLPSTPQAIGAGGAAAVSTAIAYPYYGGTPGVAPDHTIVVTGQGDSTLAADGSDRAGAEKAAIAAALADAKVQADAIAHGTGLTITGVLSVSASVSPYGPVPLGIVAPAPGVPTNGSTQAQPPVAAQESITASVTVAYMVR